MSFSIDKFGFNRALEPKKANVCRIDLPGGGIMEVRTGGNIQFDDQDPFNLARTDNPLSNNFQDNFDQYFKLANSNLKAGPSSGAK